MPITGAVLSTARRDPDRIAIADADRALSYAELVEDSTQLASAIHRIHDGLPDPPAPAPETHGIPITAISSTSAYHTARIMAGLAGFRAVSATIDPRWPLGHRVGIITATGIGLVIVDSHDDAAELRAALGADDRSKGAGPDSGGGPSGASGPGSSTGASGASGPDSGEATDSRVGTSGGAGSASNVGTNGSGDPDESIGTDSRIRPGGSAGWGGTVLTLGELRELERVARPTDPPTVRDGNEPFLLLLSSGTTDRPKAFIKTREQYRQNVAVSSAHLEPLPGVTTLAPGPVSYSLTLYAVIECLATGGSVVVADSFDPIAIGRLVETHQATRIVAVPAMVSALAAAARRHPERLATLELIVTGGANLSAPMRASLIEALPAVRLISYYGAAEIGFIGDSRSGDGTVIDVYPEIEARIRRNDGSDVIPGGGTAPQDGPGAVATVNPARSGEPGTIWIRAAACSFGYVGGTSDDLLRDPDNWATVHDQGRWVGARIELLGRAGDIAITGGHKVSLAEVERAFAELPGGLAVCAIAVPDARRGSVIGLVVEAPAAIDVSDRASRSQGPGQPDGAALPPGAEPPDSAVLPNRAALPDRASLQAIARQRLAPQFVPRRWYRTSRLPRTVGGKIRRGAVTELVTGRTANPAPDGATEGAPNTANEVVRL